MGIARFPLVGGAGSSPPFLEFEFDGDVESPQFRRLGGGAGKLFEHTEAFEDVLRQRIEPLASAVHDALTGLGPDEVELAFGIKLGGSAGFIVAKGTAEANLSIKLSWKGGASGPEPE